MTLPARALRPLLLLLVLVHQHWSAGADTVAPSSVHSEVEQQGATNRDSDHAKAGTQDQIISLERSEGELIMNSIRADFPCPDAASIAPCVCTIGSDSTIDLDCTEVESEEQLSYVFQQDFPVKNLHGFYMTSNEALQGLGNSNGVSFEVIDLYPGPFALEAISDYFLLDSSSTLTYLRIEDTRLQTDWFPFPTLANMEVLEHVAVSGSAFTWIPKISSLTIRVLRLVHGHVDNIEPGTFDDLPSLTTLSLYYNDVVELQVGAVPIHEGPMFFYGNNMGMSSVNPGAFFFYDSKSAASNEEIYIKLELNVLLALYAGTFVLRDGPANLQLAENAISFIEPKTFVLPEDTGAPSKGELFINIAENLVETLQAGTFPLWNGKVKLYLGGNLINTVEPGAFVLPSATDSLVIEEISLHGNKLTTFDEAVFGELMPFVEILYLYGNPLECGCDIAWLVQNQSFLAKVDQITTCNEGTLLHELDPSIFDVC